MDAVYLPADYFHRCNVIAIAENKQRIYTAADMLHTLNEQLKKRNKSTLVITKPAKGLYTLGEACAFVDVSLGDVSPPDPKKCDSNRNNPVCWINE